MLSLVPVTRKKITALIATSMLAVIVLVVSIAITFLIKNYLEKNLQKEFLAQERLIADQVASSLEGQIAAVKDNLKVMSAVSEIQAGVGTDCINKLEQISAGLETKVYGNIGRVNRAGIFSCSLNRPLIGQRGDSLGSYIPEIFEDPEHKPVMSRAIDVVGLKGKVFATHVPVFDEKQNFDGSLGAAIYLNEIQEKFLKSVRFSENGFVVVFDDNGDILYHPDQRLNGRSIDSPEPQKFYSKDVREKILLAGRDGMSGQLQYKAEGVEKIGSYTVADVLPGRRWVVLVTVPISDAKLIISRVGLDTGFMAFSAVLAIAVLSLAGAIYYTRIKTLELNQAKDDFFNLVTHQLQTPTTGVKLALEMLLSGKMGKINAEQEETIRMSLDSILREKWLVAKLLTVGRAESGRLSINKQKTDLARMLPLVIEEQRSAINERKQKLETSIQEVVCEADPNLLRMVFENLLSNASKYTPEGGALGVSLQSDEDSAIITFSDSGVGISAKDIPRLFKKYFRAKNVLSEEVKGTGLGLYLVKQIVDMHKGKITIESKVGQGSKFKVTLPLKSS